MGPQFSILVVCLTPGEKLKNTLDSIGRQTFTDYEIVIKDGGSTDGFLEGMKVELAKKVLVSGEHITVIETKDAGIYDAMNQAVAKARGKYVYFLNCGDLFYDENVLAVMNELIRENPSAHGIYYGNIYERLTGQKVTSNPRIDAFACYRNVPCHQACFYDRELLLAHPFRTEYSVRADYEQFLWCFFTKQYMEDVLFCYSDTMIADYEGGGFSETKKNRKLSEKEHQEIVSQYLSKAQIRKYKLIMWLTLAPVRTWLSRNKVTAGFYNRVKRMLYGGER